jgi:hypothetical protein
MKVKDDLYIYKELIGDNSVSLSKFVCIDIQLYPAMIFLLTFAWQNILL